MNHDDPPTRDLHELLSEGATLMVAVEGSLTDARPLTVAGVRNQHIEMLVDRREPWATTFADGDVVHATLSDNRANVWATLSGTGRLGDDAADIDRLWSPFASAYFDQGQDTPGIAVFTIEVDDGRWWSSPAGRLGSVISFVKAAVGDASDGGSHGGVRTDPQPG